MDAVANLLPIGAFVHLRVGAAVGHQVADLEVPQLRWIRVAECLPST